MFPTTPPTQQFGSSLSDDISTDCTFSSGNNSPFILNHNPQITREISSFSITNSPIISGSASPLISTNKTTRTISHNDLESLRNKPKQRIAFIVCCSYKNSLNVSSTDSLVEQLKNCGFICYFIKNPTLSQFQLHLTKFIESFLLLTSLNFEIIFLFNGHGGSDRNNEQKFQFEDGKSFKLSLILQNFCDQIEDHKKEVQRKIAKQVVQSSDMNELIRLYKYEFRFIFILDCCRGESDSFSCFYNIFKKSKQQQQGKTIDFPLAAFIYPVNNNQDSYESLTLTKLISDYIKQDLEINKKSNLGDLIETIQKQLSNQMLNEKIKIEKHLDSNKIYEKVLNQRKIGRIEKQIGEIHQIRPKIKIKEKPIVVPLDIEKEDEEEIDGKLFTFKQEPKNVKEIEKSINRISSDPFSIFHGDCLLTNFLFNDIDYIISNSCCKNHLNHDLPPIDSRGDFILPICENCNQFKNINIFYL